MDFVSYLDKRVYVTLLDNFFWVGHVVDIEGDFLVLIDKHNKRITLNLKSIATIREVEKI